jgi:hypothetical protein
MGLRKSAAGLRRRFCNSLSLPVTIRHRSNYCQKPLKICTISNIPRNFSSFLLVFARFCSFFCSFCARMGTLELKNTPLMIKKLQQTPFCFGTGLYMVVAGCPFLVNRGITLFELRTDVPWAMWIYRRLRYLGRSGLLGFAHRPVASFFACFIRPLNSRIFGWRNRGSAYPWPVVMSRALKSRPSGR